MSNRCHFVNFIKKSFVFSGRFAFLCGLMGVFSLLIFDGGCKKPEGNSPKQANIQELIAQGDAHLNQQQWQEAIDKYTQAIDAAPDSLQAYYHRAVACLAEGEEHYNLAKAMAENKAHHDLAQQEVDKADQRFTQVVEDCKKITELDANFAESFYLQGCVAIYQGGWDHAIELFTQCLDKSPDYAEAYQRRGEVYQHVGDTVNSTLDLKKAAELGYTDSTQTEPEQEKTE